MRDTGQSLLTWLLAQELIVRGLRVGLFRPMGVAGPEGKDPLIKLVTEVLGDQLACAAQCPVCVDPEGGVDTELVDFHMHKIEQAFRTYEKQCDICLAVGSRDIFFDTEHSSLPDSRFIEMFDARVILIDRFVTKAMTVYSTLALASFLRDRLAGIVINRVPEEAWEEFSTQTVPFLRDKGAPIFAVLPEDKVLESPTLLDLAEVLDAEVLTGESKLGNLSTGLTIGAQSLPSSMKIYKRVVNKVVLEGGTVEQVVAGEHANVCGVVLTNGRKPAEKVVEAAAAEGLPVLLTQMDTFVTIEKMAKAKIYIQGRDRFRLERFKELLTSHNPIEELIRACGVD